MDRENRKILKAVIFSVVFILFSLILMPAVIRLLGTNWGKIFYGFLSVVSVGLAIRLRILYRRLG